MLRQLRNFVSQSGLLCVFMNGESSIKAQKKREWPVGYRNSPVAAPLRLRSQLRRRCVIRLANVRVRGPCV